MVHDQAVDMRASSGPRASNGAAAAGGPAETLNEELRPAASHRVLRSLALRTRVAGSDAFRAAPAQIDNGDEARYSDKSGTYTKGVLQAGVGLVDLGAYATFKAALSSGAPADFEKIILGGPRTLNGPQAGLAFYLDSLDGSQYSVPPAPALASEAYAAELIELYWASLLRDVPFGGYARSSVATRAAAELSALPQYAGPRNNTGQVTPHLLFRGGFAGEERGPYLSQFLLQPTALGALPITQQYVTHQAGIDFMTQPAEFLDVQNGKPTGKALTPAGARYLHDGRGLAAYTHADVLFQAYFIAYLVLNTVNGALPPPLNMGNPYNGSKTQNGFGTFGQPDFAATLAAVAGAAIRDVWYQKWWVHLRHRPESGGAIVHLQKTAPGGSIEGHVSDTDESIKLGEAIALSYLRDHAHAYNEHFSVSITKLDGSVATISNP
jgi:hypothetical protein